jgi:hypothetical protein
MSNPNINQFHQNFSINFVKFPPSPYQVEIIANIQYFRTIENSLNLSQYHENQISSIQNSQISTHNSLPHNLSTLSNLVQDPPLPNTFDSTISIQNPNIINSTKHFETPNHPNLSQNHTFDDSFKLSFLKSLAFDFPSIIRKLLTEFRLLPQCSSEMRNFISIRLIKQSCVKDLIEIIQKYSSSLFLYLNENFCIYLLSQTYHEYFFLVPKQKSSRIHKFIELLAKVSFCIGTNQQLMLLQNSITNLLFKC